MPGLFFGGQNSGRFMKMLLIVPLAICTAPLYAQSIAQSDAAKLKAEARNAVLSVPTSVRRTPIARSSIFENVSRKIRKTTKTRTIRRRTRTGTRTRKKLKRYRRK